MAKSSKEKLALFFESLSTEIQTIAFSDDVFGNDELCLPVYRCAEAFRIASNHYWRECQHDLRGNCEE